MQPKNSIRVLSIFMAGIICGCAAGNVGTTAPAGTPGAGKPQSVTTPAGDKVADRLTVGDNLALTRGGIEFVGHECVGAFASKSSDVVKDANKKMVGYKLTSDCSSNNEQHVFAFSDVQYNAFGQRTAYKLKVFCSRTNKTYDIQISNITYDASWEVLTYKAVIDGKEYNYTRQ